MGSWRFLLFIAVFFGCAQDEPGPAPLPAPPIVLDLAAPWRVVEQTDAHVAVRLGDTAHGARIQVAADGRGRVPGVSPIHNGATLDAPEADRRWPLVAVAYPERALSRVEVASQEFDLTVRFYGPELHQVAQRPDAPSDPVLTWVRLRPRTTDWRVVLDGLGTLSLPSPVRASPSWTLTTPHGPVQLESGAADWRTASSRERWFFSTKPALQAIDPYPRTALTLTP
jgi:hypothetical protein